MSSLASMRELLHSLHFPEFEQIALVLFPHMPAIDRRINNLLFHATCALAEEHHDVESVRGMMRLYLMEYLDRYANTPTVKGKVELLHTMRKFLAYADTVLPGSSAEVVRCVEADYRDHLAIIPR